MAYEGSYSQVEMYVYSLGKKDSKLGPDIWFLGGLEQKGLWPPLFVSFERHCKGLLGATWQRLLETWDMRKGRGKKVMIMCLEVCAYSERWQMHGILLSLFHHNRASMFRGSIPLSMRCKGQALREGHHPLLVSFQRPILETQCWLQGTLMGSSRDIFYALNRTLD